MRVLVCLSILSVATCGMQWTTYMNSLLAEKGSSTIDFVNPSLDPINSSAYHFPKKGPPREKEFEPKWEQDRYRNYKQRPKTPMRHVLKPPTAPRGLVLGFDVKEGMDFAHKAEVVWMPPDSTGQSNITHYQISRDDGLTWKKVSGGGNVNRTVIFGLKRGQNVHVHLRAVNSVGAGPPVTTVVQNQARPSFREVQKLRATKKSCDWPIPLEKPRTQPISVQS
jgi:hypothetical protein